MNINIPVIPIHAFESVQPVMNNSCAFLASNVACGHEFDCEHETVNRAELPVLSSLPPIIVIERQAFDSGHIIVAFSHALGFIQLISH